MSWKLRDLGSTCIWLSWGCGGGGGGGYKFNEDG